ncbi:hypothetical protein GCM10027075_52410 [Streptomyces heilongjiangensis]
MRVTRKTVNSGCPKGRFGVMCGGGARVVHRGAFRSSESGVDRGAGRVGAGGSGGWWRGVRVGVRIGVRVGTRAGVRLECHCCGARADGYLHISPDREYFGRPSVLSGSNPWALVVIER